MLSHVSRTFFILNSQIGPQAFRHSHYTLRFLFFLMWRRVQFKVHFASNWSLGLWSVEPCLKSKYTCRSWFKGFRPHAWAFKLKCSASWIIYVIIYTGTITIWSEAYYRQYSTLFQCLKDSKLIMFRGQPNLIWCFTMVLPEYLGHFNTCPLNNLINFGQFIF